MYITRLRWTVENQNTAHGFALIQYAGLTAHYQFLLTVSALTHWVGHFLALSRNKKRCETAHGLAHNGMNLMQRNSRAWLFGVGPSGSGRDQSGSGSGYYIPRPFIISTPHHTHMHTSKEQKENRTKREQNRSRTEQKENGVFLSDGQNKTRTIVRLSNGLEIDWMFWKLTNGLEVD